MNKLIDQFYEECNQVVDSPFGGASICFDRRKFAELIVRKCVQVGTQAWLDNNSVTPTFPSEQIKKHFGIEE